MAFTSLSEFSVVYNEQALNHMSQQFQEVMKRLHHILTTSHHAASAVVVPGGGTYAMEAVLRQFAAPDSDILIIRLGWFSYRWSQISERLNLQRAPQVICATPITNEGKLHYSAPELQNVLDTIATLKPKIIFLPHVETSAGIRVQNQYISAITAAAHQYGALVVLDCIASGAEWLNMQQLGVDILVSAPQKCWNSPPCAGFVMLSPAALTALTATNSSSFAADLQIWHNIMQAYVNGGHAYHATMPTNALAQCATNMQQLVDYGLPRLSAAQIELGNAIRSKLEAAGFASVACEGWYASGVIVCFTDRDDMKSGAAFAKHGMQIAAGVGLACNEGDDFRTFRIGLFGLEKLKDVNKTIDYFESVLQKVIADKNK